MKRIKKYFATIIGLSLLGLLLTGCSASTAAEDYGLTKDVQVGGVVLKVDPNWKEFSNDYGVSFIGDTESVTVMQFKANTVDDMESLEENTGIDTPTQNNFDEVDKWTNEEIDFTSYSYDASYQDYYVAFGTGPNADIVIYVTADNDAEDSANTMSALFHSVSFDTTFIDKSELQTLIDSQAEYKESDFPAEAWSNYVSALDEAKRVLDRDDVTQSDIDSAASNLSSKERNLLNATDKDHPKKFDYDWYIDGQYKARNGAWVAAAVMVSHTFQDDGQRYLVATLANDDATLSEHDILLQPTEADDLSGYSVGDVLVVVGTTDEMMRVTLSAENYNEDCPAINVQDISIYK